LLPGLLRLLGSLLLLRLWGPLRLLLLRLLGPLLLWRLLSPLRLLLLLLRLLSPLRLLSLLRLLSPLRLRLLWLALRLLGPLRLRLLLFRLLSPLRLRLLLLLFRLLSPLLLRLLLLLFRLLGPLLLRLLLLLLPALLPFGSGLFLIVLRVGRVNRPEKYEQGSRTDDSNQLHRNPPLISILGVHADGQSAPNDVRGLNGAAPDGARVPKRRCGVGRDAQVQNLLQGMQNWLRETTAPVRLMAGRERLKTPAAPA